MALFLPTSAWAATPTLDLRDGARAVLSLENAKPGSSASGCLRLSYSGPEPARVHMYGQTSGTGFDHYLELEITKAATCTASARSTLVYKGTLEGFPDGPSSAIEERWSSGESHAYRFAISVRDDNAAQGLKARQTFVWSAETPIAGTTSERDQGSDALLPAPDPKDVSRLLSRIVAVAAEVGKRSAFPGALLMMVLGFITIQNRIDRKDPKLALAPVYPTPDLSFGPPEGRESQ